MQNITARQYSCSLCKSCATEHLLATKNQEYYRCLNCLAISVPRHQHLKDQEEKAIYDLHKNDPNDPHYRNFLSKVTDPLVRLMQAPCVGLDYGCGPGPTLSLMLEEKGYKVHLYDPYYYPDQTIFDHHYDFITLTEVAEHLSDPTNTFKTLISMLKTDGLLAIMTSFIPSHLEFKNWGYKNDPTHITFYDKQSFFWLEKFLNCEIVYLEQNVVIFKKLVS